jgi:lipid-binding SYLF domain-containing protein
MLSWSRSQGVFAGVDLSGGTLKPDKDDNRKLYGRPVSARDILVDKRVTPTPEEAPFMTALGRNVSAESPHRQ